MLSSGEGKDVTIDYNKVYSICRELLFAYQNKNTSRYNEFKYYLDYICQSKGFTWRITTPYLIEVLNADGRVEFCVQNEMSPIEMSLNKEKIIEVGRKMLLAYKRMDGASYNYHRQCLDSICMEENLTWRLSAPYSLEILNKSGKVVLTVQSSLSPEELRKDLARIVSCRYVHNITVTDGRAVADMVLYRPNVNRPVYYVVTKSMDGVLVVTVRNECRSWQGNIDELCSLVSNEFGEAVKGIISILDNTTVKSILINAYSTNIDLKRSVAIFVQLNY